MREDLPIKILQGTRKEALQIFYILDPWEKRHIPGGNHAGLFLL